MTIYVNKGNGILSLVACWIACIIPSCDAFVTSHATLTVSGVSSASTVLTSPYHKPDQVPKFDSLSHTTGAFSTQGLHFKGFSITSPDTAQGNYIIPASGHNYARYLHSSITENVSIDQASKPANGGTLENFQLLSFEFACTKPSKNNGIGVATPCNIFMVGNCGCETPQACEGTGDGQEHQFMYNPAEQGGEKKMKKAAVTNGFKMCDYYTMSTGSANDAPILFLDNLYVLQHTS